MKYINADNLYNSFGTTGNCDTCKVKYDCEMGKSQYDLGDICSHIEYADAIEIVRCKECKHYEKIGALLSDPPKPIWGCHLTKHKINPDDYCSEGERKTE